MNLTAQQLAEAVLCPSERAEKWLSPLNSAMSDYEINTAQRIAAFLAQIGHESGKLVFVREIWGPTPQQANYEGRQDLGNFYTGDGFKYRGRGLIQITGRANYKQCGDAMGLDLESHPELLEQPDIAARSAAWYWKEHGCNEYADADRFNAITRAINGGSNGMPDRVALWNSARAVLSVSDTYFMG